MISLVFGVVETSDNMGRAFVVVVIIVIIISISHFITCYFNSTGQIIQQANNVQD